MNSQSNQSNNESYNESDNQSYNESYNQSNNQLKFDKIKQFDVLHKLFNSNKIDYENNIITSHIKASIQIIILSYPFELNEIVPGTGLKSLSELIALEAIEKYYMTNDVSRPKTYSIIYCPLIWTTLKKSNLPNTDSIPNEWTNDFCNEFADRLLKIPGWDIYALEILSNDELMINMTHITDEFTENNYEIAKQIIQKINQFD